MLPTGIHKVPTRREWFGQFVAGPGIAQRPISPHQREAVVGSPCRLMEQGFAVSAVLSAMLPANRNSSGTGMDKRATLSDVGNGSLEAAPELRPAPPRRCGQTLGFTEGCLLGGTRGFSLICLNVP